MQVPLCVPLPSLKVPLNVNKHAMCSSPTNVLYLCQYIFTSYPSFRVAIQFYFFLDIHPNRGARALGTELSPLEHRFCVRIMIVIFVPLSVSTI